MDDSDWQLSERDRNVIPALLYLHFSKALTRYKDLLQRAKEHGALDYTAWLARNILELRVWVKYCSHSQPNAEEFHEDAVRDLNDLKVSVGGVSPEDVKTLGKATRGIGKNKPVHKFKDIRIAAAEVGLKRIFQQNNKVLSKFVHPTAMSLVAPIPEPGAASVRKMFVDVGTVMADEAQENLDNSLLGKAYQKYRQSIERVIAVGHPEVP